MKIKYSQRFLQKVKEHPEGILDKVFSLVDLLEQGRPVDSIVMGEFKNQKIYRYRVSKDLLVIYTADKESCSLVDLVSYDETYRLMRSAK
ncbi:hypothetical protein [Pantoea sp. DY-5]|uniref:hypothetical protein n=1 Tax=Pantoea sp. DY-5 TaxID=2871488 RepID=UPI001C94DEBB|nr:hypothetical protein [Pantoea sp. DY-5]MBY4841218.1 hypothetical protein [Pantoea sp. DY-5]